MDPKPNCKYGEKCYRKNPAHLNDFQHPDAKSNVEEADVPMVPVLDSPPKESTVATITDTTAGETTTNASEITSTSETNESATTAEPAEQTSSTAPEATVSKEKPRRSLEDLAVPQAKKHAAGGDMDATPKLKCFDGNTDVAQLKEYKELVADRPQFIRQKFMVNMPDDFYKFWEFCESQNALEPYDALRIFRIILVGPYDVLAGKFDDLLPLEPASYLQHSRYYYDPPEFQTVLIHQVLGSKRSSIHFGYWRDDPADENGQCFVARNDEDAGCEVTLVGDNIFVAVLNYLENDSNPSPFVRVATATMIKKIKAFAEKHKIPLDEFEKKQRERNKLVVSRTFHKAGLVVPVDPKTQVGYRPLQENDASLKKLLARLDDPADGDSETTMNVVMEKLQPLIAAANIAVDECDFGNSIELGIDFFCSGSKRLHAIAMQLLATGYSQVRRPQLIAILKAHLSDRRLGGPTDLVLEAPKNAA